MWSLEKLDSVSKLELCTRGGKVRILLGKQVDIRRFDMLIAMCVLGE